MWEYLITAKFTFDVHWIFFYFILFYEKKRDQICLSLAGIKRMCQINPFPRFFFLSLSLFFLFSFSLSSSSLFTKCIIKEYGRSESNEVVFQEGNVFSFFLSFFRFFLFGDGSIILLGRNANLEMEYFIVQSACTTQGVDTVTQADRQQTGRQTQSVGQAGKQLVMQTVTGKQTD